ncbi:MAG TPA: glycosyltransferase family 2 protein, partial [Candidatus Paceibacterota bacterium]
SFFPFCVEMLRTYREDERVMIISGPNFGTSRDIGRSYFFSKYPKLWGWATWKRVWEKYDVNMSSWLLETNKKTIKRAVGNSYWKEKKWLYDQLFSGKKDTWDYQLEYVALLHNGLTVVPGVNLIQNIGFGSDATHTSKENPEMSIDRRSLKFPLFHPDRVELNKKYDKRQKQRTSVIKRILKKLL